MISFVGLTDPCGFLYRIWKTSKATIKRCLFTVVSSSKEWIRRLKSLEI